MVAMIKGKTGWGRSAENIGGAPQHKGIRILVSDLTNCVCAAAQRGTIARAAGNTPWIPAVMREKVWGGVGWGWVGWLTRLTRWLTLATFIGQLLDNKLHTEKPENGVVSGWGVWLDLPVDFLATWAISQSWVFRFLG